MKIIGHQQGLITLCKILNENSNINNDKHKVFVIGFDFLKIRILYIIIMII